MISPTQLLHDTNILSQISERLSNTYIGNVSPKDFIHEYRGYIPLDQFLCIIYGMDEQKTRQIEFIQFLFCTHTPKLLYQIYLFTSNETKWILDNKTLRSTFFHFKDLTSLMRTTFLYNPKDGELYRLFQIKPYLYLPYKEEKNGKVYMTWEEWKIFQSLNYRPSEDEEEKTFYLPPKDKIYSYMGIMNTQSKKQILKRKIEEIQFLENTLH